MVTSSAPIANTTKTFLVFDLPFLFTSEKVADTVLDGPLARKFSIRSRVPA
jgi:TRAP-type C4-dicarboxylate transport system substrate-binding protein